MEDTPGGTCRIKRIVSNLKRDRGGYSNQCKITTPEEGSSVFANQLPSSCAIQLRELASFITKFCIIDTCNTDKCIIDTDQQKIVKIITFAKKEIPRSGPHTILTGPTTSLTAIHHRLSPTQGFATSAHTQSPGWEPYSKTFLHYIATLITFCHHILDAHCRRICHISAHPGPWVGTL